MGTAVYTLEVGQGDAHAIISGRRCILIDAGPSNSRLLSFLRRYVDEFEAIVLTHNDRDHAGYASQILQEYGPRGAVRAFWSLQDRDPAARANAAIACAFELSSRPGGPRLYRCERADRPRIIGKLGGDTRVMLLHPWYLDAIAATGAADLAPRGPNRASAVLRLEVGGQGIALWAGDLPGDAWSKVANRHNVTAKVFVVPHHGSSHDWKPEQIENALQSVNPKWVLFSVGTHNQYFLPSRRWMDAAQRHGATVICTQITSGCHAPLKSLGKAVLPRLPELLAPTGVACGGTIEIRVDSGYGRFREHQDSITNVVTHPLCRSITRT